MIRIGSITLMLGLSLSLLGSAQDGPPMPKKIPPEDIRELPPDKEIPEPLLPLEGKGGKEPVAKGESPKEIIERLHKNMEKTNEQLKDKNDPSLTTRKLQTDIIDDLEKLIKQQQDNESC